MGDDSWVEITLDEELENARYGDGGAECRNKDKTYLGATYSVLSGV
jgi:hypothetical protein